MRRIRPTLAAASLIVLLWTPLYAQEAVPAPTVHVWEPYEIELTAAQPYDNPYTEVPCWVTLDGPGFSKRVYGFWDGGDRFMVRVVATAPGAWRWTSGSNRYRLRSMRTW